MIFILEVTQPKNSYKGIHSVVCDCQILRFFFLAIYAEHNLITVGISTILSKKDFKYFLMFHFDFIIYFNSCGQKVAALCLGTEETRQFYGDVPECSPF